MVCYTWKLEVDNSLEVYREAAITAFHVSTQDCFEKDPEKPVFFFEMAYRWLNSSTSGLMQADHIPAVIRFLLQHQPVNFRVGWRDANFLAVSSLKSSHMQAYRR